MSSSTIPMAPPQYVKLTITGRRDWDWNYQAYVAHSSDVYQVRSWQDDDHLAFLDSTLSPVSGWAKKEYCIPVEYNFGRWEEIK